MIPISYPSMFYASKKIPRKTGPLLGRSPSTASGGSGGGQTLKKPSDAQQGAAAAAVGEGEHWACSACTFLNHPALSLCECCEMPRIKQGTIVDPALEGCKHNGFVCYCCYR